MLLYNHSALDKLLLANVMGHNVLLFGTSSHPQLMPSLNCRRPVPRLIPEFSVSRYRSFDASYNFIHVPCLVRFLTLTQLLIHAVNVHSVFTHVSFLRVSHTSAVTGENLLK